MRNRTAIDESAVLATRCVQLRVVVAVTVVWIGALIAVAMRTANPVTLNVAQIRNADVVVAATVVDVDRGEVEVESSWPRESAGGKITIDGLRSMASQTGKAYLIPLKRSRSSGFQIAEVPSPAGSHSSDRYIYPISTPKQRESAVAQLNLLLQANQ